MLKQHVPKVGLFLKITVNVIVPLVLFCAVMLVAKVVDVALPFSLKNN